MAHRIKIKRMFKDPFMPQSHTYHLYGNGAQEHLCNLTHEYSPYHKKRMWHLDPVTGPSDKYPTKNEAIADALEYLARSTRPGRTLADEYLKERHLTFIPLS